MCLLCNGKWASSFKPWTSVATINIHLQLAFLSTFPDQVSSNTKCSEQILHFQSQDTTKPKPPQQSLHLYTHSHGRTFTRVEVIQQSLSFLNLTQPSFTISFSVPLFNALPYQKFLLPVIPQFQCPTPNYILLVPSYFTSPWRSGDRFSQTSHTIKFVTNHHFHHLSTTSQSFMFPKCLSFRGRQGILGKTIKYIV